MGTKRQPRSSPKFGPNCENKAIRNSQYFCSIFFCLKKFIEVQLIYNIVLVFSVQQSDSVIHIHISIPFQILVPHRALQNIQQVSLCWTERPFQLSIMFMVICICQSHFPNLFLPLTLDTTCVFYICNSISVL